MKFTKTNILTLTLALLLPLATTAEASDRWNSLLGERFKDKPITSKNHNNKCLTINKNKRVGSGYEVKMITCNGGSNQNWFSGASRILIQKENLCLQAEDGIHKAMVAAPCKTIPKQNWALTKEGEIKSGAGYCMNAVKQPDGFRQGKIITYSCTGNENQFWYEVAKNVGEVSKYNHFKISSAECGFEFDEDAGTPDTLDANEHVAKWDCGRYWGDPLFRKGNKIYTKIKGKTCGLQWDSDKGAVSGDFVDAFDVEIGENEHLAKFDCTNAGDELIFEGNKIYSMISGKKCGLEWNATKGDVNTIGDNERLAKWDCAGSADRIEINITEPLDLRIPSAADSRIDFTCKAELYDIPIPWNRKSNKHIDGCSNTGADEGHIIASDYARLFRGACIMHDVCYRAPWRKSGKYPDYKGKDICEKRFLNDMIDICTSTSFTLGPLGQAECLLAADSFAIGVDQSFFSDQPKKSFDSGQNQNEGDDPLCKLD